MKRHFLKILAVSAALSIFISNAAYAGTWTTDSGQWKYRQDDGTYAKGWLQDTDGRWYYFDANGRMLSNTAISPVPIWSLSPYNALHRLSERPK